MKPTGADPIERRLRLLLAREFAARGYYLDAEDFYAGERMDTMSAEELELLARVAALRGDWSRAESRFASLADKCAAPEHASAAKQLATHALGQSGKPLGAAPRRAGRARLIGLIILTLLIGIMATALGFWAAGLLSLPVK